MAAVIDPIKLNNINQNYGQDNGLRGGEGGERSSSNGNINISNMGTALDLRAPPPGVPMAAVCLDADGKNRILARF